MVILYISALFRQNVIVMPIKSSLSQKSVTNKMRINGIGFRVCFGIRDFTVYVFGLGTFGNMVTELCELKTQWHIISTVALYKSALGVNQ